MSETVLAVPPFFRSDAPIRPHSKIPRRAMPKLCLAFCWPKSVAETARLNGFSAPTVKAVYFSLRELLLDTRYRKWHSFARQSPLRLDPLLSELLWQLLWSCYAECYRNQECQRNFLYGHRKERECSTCPILKIDLVAEYVDKSYRSHWLRIVDRTRDFYLNTLGIRREDGFPREIFKRRVYHQQVINAARFHSRTTRGKDGNAVDHLKRGPSTVLDLWETLLKHIAERGGL